MTQNQRTALFLLNGLVYVAWGAHDHTDPNQGWLIAYNASGLQQARIFNTTPYGSNGGHGGIWMSGAGPAIDASGNIYFSTADGSFDWGGELPPVPPNVDFGDTVIKLSTGGGSLSIADFFTPFNEFNLDSNNTDLGSSGVVLLPDFAPPGPTHMLIAAGKEGKLYLIDRDNMGKINNQPNGPDLVLQSIFFTNGGFFGSPTFWNNTFYGGPAGSPISALTFDPVAKQFNTGQPPPPTNYSFDFPGASPAISALGTSNGILWAIDSSAFSSGGPAVLLAFDASNLSNQLYDTTQAAGNRDQAGPGVKFTVPTVANGRVYVGTQGEVDVYGLLP